MSWRTLLFTSCVPPQAISKARPRHSDNLPFQGVRTTREYIRGPLCTLLCQEEDLQRKAEEHHSEGRSVETAHVEDLKSLAPETHAHNKKGETEHTRNHASRNQSICAQKQGRLAMGRPALARNTDKTAAGKEKLEHSTEAHVRVDHDHANTETNTASDRHNVFFFCCSRFLFVYCMLHGRRAVVSSYSQGF